MANTAINHDPVATFPGSSTNTAVVKWSGTSGNALLDSGVIIDGSNNVTGLNNVTATGYLHLTGDEKELRFYEGANYIAIAAPSGLGADYTFTLPLNDGAADEFLQTNGSGVLVWAAAAGTTINSNADNRVITGSGTANTLEGEQYLTFSGNNMVLQSTSGGSGQSSLYIETYKSTASGWHGGQLVLRLSMNNTIGSHTVIQADHTIGNIDFEGSDGSAFYRSARIVTEAGQNWSGSAKGSRMKFFTTSNGATSFTERMRIETDGDVNVKSGNLVIGTADKGIDFAVTGNSSGTTQSEVLDDYEEGIFSPTMLFGGANSGISYTEQSGSYTKIGDRVMYSLRLRVSDKGSSTGSLQIGGLPFTTGSGTRNYGSQSNIYVDKIASSGTMIAYNYTAGTVLDIRTVNTSGTNADVTNSDVTNGLTLHISGHYCTRALG